MLDERVAGPADGPYLRSNRVYALAVLSLVVGLVAGYLLPGGQSRPSTARRMAYGGPPLGSGGPPDGASVPGPQQVTPRNDKQSLPVASGEAAVSSVRPGHGGHMPSQEEMRQMADSQAAPLIEQLKSNPNDKSLLTQIGGIYHTTHQYKEAAFYYDRALQIEPRNVALRTKLASSLYREGDVDGAIAQLNRALSYDPKDANSLFDLGMIRLQGKRDGKGALEAWQRLLKSNPQLSNDRKATVQGLMADVLTTLANQNGIRGARSNEPEN